MRYPSLGKARLGFNVISTDKLVHTAIYELKHVYWDLTLCLIESSNNINSATHETNYSCSWGEICNSGGNVCKVSAGATAWQAADSCDPDLLQEVMSWTNTLWWVLMLVCSLHCTRLQLLPLANNCCGKWSFFHFNLMVGNFYQKLSSVGSSESRNCELQDQFISFQTE